MKKALALLLSLFLLVTAFAGCAQGGQTPDPAEDPKAAENAPEAQTTDAPETDAPETEAPETEAPETEAPAEPDALRTVAEDNSVMRMHFLPPEGYETVDRLITRDADGELLDKTISFYFEDDDMISYAFIPDYDLDRILEYTTGSAEYAGVTFYTLTQYGNLYAFAGEDGGVYGVTLPLEDVGGSDAL